MSAELRAVIERELAYVAGNDVLAGRLVEARDRILAASSDTAPLDEGLDSQPRMTPKQLAHSFAMKYGLREKLTYDAEQGLEADLAIFLRAALAHPAPLGVPSEEDGLREALREAYTLLVSAEPTLIRDARTAPNATSAHYKALLRDRVTEWLDPMRNDFDGWLDRGFA